MANLYHIYIKPKLGVSREQVERKLDLALDWIRYTDGCYLVYSSHSTGLWNIRLKPLVQNGGHVLILDIDPHAYHGWMPKDLWPWLNDKKTKIYGETGET
jgi:hypothetical protein